MSERYFSKVAESAVADVANAIKGSRNEILNKAAFSLGRHAHMAPANLDAAISELHSAAKAMGLQDHEIKATIGSGFKRGGDSPKGARKLRRAAVHAVRVRAPDDAPGRQGSAGA
jgi:hypothetical protein